MLVTRVSMFTGIEHTLELPITEAQYREYFYSESPRLIQHIFPNLTAEQREFIKSGVTPEEWNKTFGKKRRV